jgi:hypothetical protein
MHYFSLASLLVARLGFDGYRESEIHLSLIITDADT